MWGCHQCIRGYSVHWGISSVYWEDIMVCGGYHECTGGCLVHWADIINALGCSLHKWIGSVQYCAILRTGQSLNSHSSEIHSFENVVLILFQVKGVSAIRFGTYAPSTMKYARFELPAPSLKKCGIREALRIICYAVKRENAASWYLNPSNVVFLLMASLYSIHKLIRG